jgi:light-independent protochlorophyllide reductase subunit B
VRARPKRYGLEALITDDYLEVEARSPSCAGTGARHADGAPHRQALGIPCAVISAPVHVQDYPARYSPQMGFEGANVIFDTWVHPLMMGLEEHLLAMFREDFEFHDDAAPVAPRSQRRAGPAGTAGHGASGTGMAREKATAVIVPTAPPLPTARPGTEAEKELRKIPFFVRGKARRNTERYASERGVSDDQGGDAV